MAALPALNPRALGRALDVQSHGDACLVRRRRRDRVRTNSCERPPFLKCRVLRPLQSERSLDQSNAGDLFCLGLNSVVCIVSSRVLAVWAISPCTGARFQVSLMGLRPINPSSPRDFFAV